MCVQLPRADLSLGLGWKELSLLSPGAAGSRCAILGPPQRPAPLPITSGGGSKAEAASRGFKDWGSKLQG